MNYLFNKLPGKGQQRFFGNVSDCMICEPSALWNRRAFNEGFEEEIGIKNICICLKIFKQLKIEA